MIRIDNWYACLITIHAPGRSRRGGGDENLVSLPSEGESEEAESSESEEEEESESD